MSDFEQKFKQAVCSETGRLIFPAVSGLAVTVVTSPTLAGAAVAGAGAATAASSIQQLYCDGSIAPGRTLTAAAMGAGGAVVGTGGRLLVAAATTWIATSGTQAEQTLEELDLPTMLRNAPKIINQLRAPFAPLEQTLAKDLEQVRGEISSLNKWSPEEMTAFARRLNVLTETIDRTRRSFGELLHQRVIVNAFGRERAGMLANGAGEWPQWGIKSIASHVEEVRAYLKKPEYDEFMKLFEKAHAPMTRMYNVSRELSGQILSSARVALDMRGEPEFQKELGEMLQNVKRMIEATKVAP